MPNDKADLGAKLIAVILTVMVTVALLVDALLLYAAYSSAHRGTIGCAFKTCVEAAQ